MDNMDEMRKCHEKFMNECKTISQAKTREELDTSINKIKSIRAEQRKIIDAIIIDLETQKGES